MLANSKKRKTFFKKRYRVSSARLPDWDYRRPDFYFVTIVTKGFICHFGHVKDAKMVLNNLGQFVHEDILHINTCCDYVRVKNHVVMPNHVHAIIEFTNHASDYKTNRFGPLQKKSLSSVVNHHKGRVTKFANSKNIKNWGWLPRFHDHIIRNPFDYENCWNYISNNPQKWHRDRFFKQKSQENL